MSQPAIAVERLSKAYRLAHARRQDRTLREVLVDAAAAPFRRLRGEAGGPTEMFWALRDVSFSVRPGEIVGIIGRNGAGKSTLLKILSRITEPTSGRAELQGRVASLLEVGTGFHPDLTGRENIFLNGALLGMTQAEVRRKFDAIVAFSEVEKFLDTAVKHYSSGMYVRLAFAVAAHLETEILLVDEVLAVGDAAFQHKCLGKVRDLTGSGDRTVIFVSHNMTAVSYLCDRGVVLQNAQVAFEGAAGKAVDYYHHQLLPALGSGTRQAHVLYEAPDNATPSDFAVTRVEMLSPSGSPKPLLSTGDDIMFRLTFSAARPLVRGCVFFEVSTIEGVRLLTLSTQPDGTLPVEFKGGAQAVECTIRKLPLAAGEYIFGAGLAIPNVEYLWRNSELATLSILPADVYRSGLAPVSTRSLLAVDHEWRLAPVGEAARAST